MSHPAPDALIQESDPAQTPDTSDPLSALSARRTGQCQELRRA